MFNVLMVYSFNNHTAKNEWTSGDLDYTLQFLYDDLLFSLPYEMSSQNPNTIQH